MLARGSEAKDRKREGEKERKREEREDLLGLPVAADRVSGAKVRDELLCRRRASSAGCGLARGKTEARVHGV